MFRKPVGTHETVHHDVAGKDKEQGKENPQATRNGEEDKERRPGDQLTARNGEEDKEQGKETSWQLEMARKNMETS